jgi:hypothetical protein
MGIEHFRQAERGVSRQVCRAGGGSRFDQAVIHADKEARAAADRATMKRTGSKSLSLGAGAEQGLAEAS